MKNYFGAMFKALKHFYVAESNMILGKFAELHNYCSNVTSSVHDSYYLYILIIFIIMMDLMGRFERHKWGKYKRHGKL